MIILEDKILYLCLICILFIASNLWWFLFLRLFSSPRLFRSWLKHLKHYPCCRRKHLNYVN